MTSSVRGLPRPSSQSDDWQGPFSRRRGRGLTSPLPLRLKRSFSGSEMFRLIMRTLYVAWIAVVPATAQVTESDLARCRLITSSILRLECYDALAKPVRPSAWKYEAFTAPFENAQSQFVHQEVDAYRIGGLTLAIRCRDDVLWVGFLSGMDLRNFKPERLLIVYRIDQREVQYEMWDAWSVRSAGLHGAEAIKFIAVLKEGQRLSSPSKRSSSPCVCYCRQ